MFSAAFDLSEGLGELERLTAARFLLDTEIVAGLHDGKICLLHVPHHANVIITFQTQ
jgi:hypothetical protein